ncbi:MAG: hypothetical protein K0S23_1470 [Fluviicola sp.]|jgi:hypothetical protein|uniref:T9SS type A sorting domain-containing protein n=1 Tax=Fluviicola sp. TaxID=1917219 RepID=UPI00263A073E|nr:T9SS type A sorting domain-containing protein [Fluviicola sp.]MDF3027163.1 hypothetical protein [Fluviicola sp.]
MKKHFLLLALLGATSFLNAQSIPNGGFETWVDYTFYEDPQNWSGMNVMTMLGADPTAVKSTDAHSGNYALKLVTSVSDIGGDGEMDTVPGIIMLGNVDMMSGTGTAGAAFTQRPDSLTGWYKLISPTNVPFQLQFSSTKWDVGTQSTETISIASYLGNASSSYVRFSIPITYTENGNPDSIQIIMSNTYNGSGVGNQLFIDDLSFVYNTPAGLEEETSAFILAPNPVTSALRIQSDLPMQNIRITDLNGRTVFETDADQFNYQVETADFTNGIYYCTLFFENGSSQQQKFIKQ